MSQAQDVLSAGAGQLPPGTFELRAPLVLSGRLRGDRQGTRLVATFTDRPAVEATTGSLEQLELVGGEIGVNVRNEARRVSLERVWIRDAKGVGLWIGHGEETSVSNVVVQRAGDNGIQLESPQGADLRSVVVLGPVGNKAVDCSHRGPGFLAPRRVRLRHLTVLDPHGYGIGLAGWRAGEGHLLANSLILERDTGAGASGYSVLVPNGPDVGTFVGNVANAPALGLEGRAVVLGARPDDLAGVWPKGFDLATRDKLGGDWGALDNLRPLVAGGTLWEAGIRFATLQDILGRYRRLRGLRVAAGALG
jgi:hypothetical protein